MNSHVNGPVRSAYGDIVGYMNTTQGIEHGHSKAQIASLLEWAELGNDLTDCSGCDDAKWSCP